MSKLNENSPAPPFTTTDQDGSLVKLEDFRGKKVILYFYPKDDTPGCTKEACAFRDAFAEFKSKNTIILGVSPDNEKSHTKFIEKFTLPFQLLCDTEKTIAKDYEVWVEKSMYGRKYMGVERSTFLIDENGRLAAIRRKVKPEPHVEELLKLV
jgi:peroxiredoxin Q/BCP